MDSELKNARDALARASFTTAGSRTFDDIARIQIAQSALLVAIADRLMRIDTMCGAIRRDQFEPPYSDTFNPYEYPCTRHAGHPDYHADRDGDAWPREE